jgi:hypothetical protein
VEINKESIINLLERRDLDLLPPESRSLLIGLFSDGLQGLMDAAVVNNIDKIPAPIREIVAPYLLEIDWNNVPSQIASAFNSLFREDGPGLMGSIKNLLGSIDLSNFNIGEFFQNFNLNLGGINLNFNGIRDVIGMISSGKLGGISQVLSDFGGIDLLGLIPGSGIIKTASTIFGVLFKEGDILSNLFGGGGLGITSILGALGVSDTITGLISPILGIFGLGGLKSSCPCDPKCRKTDHLVSENGIRLLEEEKCETVISNSSSSYYSGGGSGRPDPSFTNGNLLSNAFGLVTTQLGAGLIPQNVLNLTAAILELPRLGSLGAHSQSAQFADWPDFMNEYSYSMKTIEHGFKITDNNLTGVEKILRVFLDGQFFDSAFEQKRDDQVIETLSDTANAVKELYTMVKILDRTKRGSSGVYKAPAVAVKKMIKSHTKLINFRAANWAKHLKKIKDFLELGLSLWKELQPGKSYDSQQEKEPGSSENSGVDTPFNLEEMNNDTSRFNTEYYKAMSDMVHTDNDAEINDIFEKIGLKDNGESEEKLSKFRKNYENTLRRLTQERISEQTGIPANRDPSMKGYTPVSSDSRRQSISAQDLQRLSEETGLNDFNTLVKTLLDEQAAAERRKENC